MTISNAQRIERRMWIGSSDVPAICGVDQHKSIVDIWYSKVHSSKDWGGNAYTDAGDYAEEGLVRFAEDQLGVPQCTAIRNAQFKRDDGTPFSANTDGWLEELGIIIEAKQTGAHEDWGRPCTDEVPDKALFQVHQQMYCSGAKKAIIPVAMGFRGVKYIWYMVERSEEVIDFMLAECQRFWHEHVLPQIKPEGPTPRLDTLKLLDREPEETVHLTQALVDEWNEARAAMSEWRKEKERLDVLILGELEVRDKEGKVRLAEIGLAENGYIDYTAGPKGRRAMNWKAEPWTGETSSE